MHWENKTNEPLYLISIPDSAFDRPPKPNIKKMENVKGLMTTKNAKKVFLIETIDNTDEMVLSSLPTVNENDIKQVNGKIVILGHSKVMATDKSSVSKYLKVKLKERIELYEKQMDNIKNKHKNPNPSTWSWHNQYVYETNINKIKNIKKYYGVALDAIKSL